MILQQLIKCWSKTEPLQNISEKTKILQGFSFVYRFNSFNNASNSSADMEVSYG